ncbi:AraC family transcriptional regulator [Actinoplanes sp. NPDC051475]|uniref:AraC family transcriptional regulator n=1 Tax=Actinoplanes sp. NPDC051475 TaxID=3157225 RepID=UPI003450893C
MDDGTVSRFSLESDDVEEIRSFGAAHYFPRRFLHPQSRSGRLAARFDILSLGPLSICDARYGADVTLGYDAPDAYQVGVPLSGHLEAHQAGRALLSAGDRAVVSRAGEDVVLDRWSADGRQLVVKIDREFLECRLQDQLDVAIRGPIALAGRLDVAGGRGRSWAALARLVAAEFNGETGMFDHPLVVGRLRETLALGLLLAVDHPYRAELNRPARCYRPPLVRRAVEAIHARPEYSYTVADLAIAAGASVRTLQGAFRRYVGCTPMAYLRQVRLARAHDDLRAADPGTTTVAEVAYRWGFLHLGRFAAAYRARYHATPSRTLQGP